MKLTAKRDLVDITCNYAINEMSPNSPAYWDFLLFVDAHLVITWQNVVFSFSPPPATFQKREENVKHVYVEVVGLGGHEQILGG